MIYCELLSYDSPFEFAVIFIPHSIIRLQISDRYLFTSNLFLVHDINAVDKNGLTALMWSSAYGQNLTVSLLLQEGADVHSKGNRLETALHFAAAGGHHDIVKQLISYGADINILDEVSYHYILKLLRNNFCLI